MTLKDIDDLRLELREEFDIPGVTDLLPKTIRLIFQDCSGPSEDDTSISICNGCINYENPNNKGLKDEAVDKLDEIFLLGEWNQKMTRADLWAAAATIAIEYAYELDTNSDGTLPTIPYYFGRTDCSETAETSKYKAFPSAQNGWIDTNQWFNHNLGFTSEETVAILGAHTLGQKHLSNSGYSNLPWVSVDHAPHKLNNQYYKNLINRNLDWTQSESSVDGIWEYKDANNQISMLNSDISLVIDIDNSFDEIFNGKVNCQFEECPVNYETIDLVEKYANSNQEWLNWFARAFEKLILMGYNSEALDKLVPDSATITTTTTTTVDPIQTTIALKSTNNLMTTKTDVDDFYTSEYEEMDILNTIVGDIYTSQYEEIDVSNLFGFSITLMNTESKEGILDKLNDYCGEYCGVIALCAVIGVVIISFVLICIWCCKRNKDEEEDYNPSAV